VAPDAVPRCEIHLAEGLAGLEVSVEDAEAELVAERLHGGDTAERRGV
jgi:hypothetical protein